MSAVRSVMSVGMIVALFTLIGAWLAVESRAQTADKPSIAGGWTLNADQSDHPSDRDGDRAGRRDGGGGYGRRGGGRGGFGGGRGGYGRGMPENAEETARRRDAMRDIINPPTHLVITETESMIVMTSPDGRTTRLSPDGKKVKDEATGIERRTKWEAGKLVSDISGAGGMRLTETYAIAPETHQLRVSVQIEGGRGGQARTVTHVYDADAR
jgi:hypothetical protein